MGACWVKVGSQYHIDMPYYSFCWGVRNTHKIYALRSDNRLVPVNGRGKSYTVWTDPNRGSVYAIMPNGESAPLREETFGKALFSIGAIASPVTG